jgi:uncharacterized protein (TIGR03437 family)
MSQLIRANPKTRPVAAVIRLIPIACILLAASSARSQNIITTVAGDGATAYSGDGGLATNAALNLPWGVVFASTGMIYIADMENYRIRLVTPEGMISTIAGTGVSGYSGDGGLASAAMFSDVAGLAMDKSGNLYVADRSNVRIREVAANGIVTTVAGTGKQGFSGDGGLATEATLNTPTSVLVDPSGNLYFTDSSNQRIRRVGTDGIITTVAGNGVNGFSGDGGLAINAAMSFPLGLALDQSGNLYFTDGNNNRVRMITPAGIISTFAGNGAGTFAGDGGQATSASINIPSDVTIDSSGNMYIADSGNNRIRKVDPSGIITTIAGTADNGFSGDGGLATAAELNFPAGVITDSAGDVYMTDRVNSRVRMISAPALGVPALQNGTAVNGATFTNNVAIAPGAIVTIFGSNLAVGAVSAPGAPYPTVIGETSVTFNGIPAPLFYVSASQINAQAPYTLGLGTASIQVTRGSMVSPVGEVNVAYVSPGIFIVNQATNQGAILRYPAYSLVGSSNPARTGDTVLIYATGLGPLQVPVASGVASPAVATIALPVVKIGGVNATVSYSGLAYGFAGLYQLNVVVPPGLTAGNLAVQITTSGMSSNVATMAVEP